MSKAEEKEYWTRKLEIKLVNWVRIHPEIWRGSNSNPEIAERYRAYAQFAAMLGPGWTARTIRDRWINIRSTFRHNLRKVRSNPSHVPSWPLWIPLQFLLGESNESVIKDEQQYLSNEEECSKSMDQLRAAAAALAPASQEQNNVIDSETKCWGRAVALQLSQMPTNADLAYQEILSLLETT